MEAAYLAACALSDQLPEMDDAVNLEDLYRFCKFHSITSIVAMALEEVWKTNPAAPEIMQKWRQARDKAIRKNILLNAERVNIIKYLESIGCWYMPLKGSLLQFDYPKFGMRQMGDNDILFDVNFQERIYDYMISNGYEAVYYRKGNHDEYVKKPVYNIEMHKGLFMSSQNPVLSAYYQNVKQRMIKDEENSFGFHLSEADFYIYLVAHAYKHYVYSGIGIRNLLDSYVYLSRHGDHLDWDYISRELKKIGADDFEAECRQLASKLLENPCRNPDLSEADRTALDIYFTSGTFGTEMRTMEKKLRTGSGGFIGKMRYLLGRLFPSAAYMIDMEPELEKKRWMLPFAYVRRLFRAVFLRSGDIRREMDRMQKVNPAEKK